MIPIPLSKYIYKRVYNKERLVRIRIKEISTDDAKYKRIYALYYLLR